MNVWKDKIVKIVEEVSKTIKVLFIENHNVDMIL